MLTTLYYVVYHLANSPTTAWHLLGIFVFFPLVFFLVLLGIRFWMRRATKGSDNPKKLDGKIVVITGANAGIGKEAAIDLAKRNAKIVICCRSEEKAEAAVEEIKSLTSNENVEFVKLDLASLASVRKCAETIQDKYEKIDYLINNAGLICPQKETEDGLEMMMGTNHFGHFLLTQLLTPLLKKSAESGHRPRIVNVSSLAHKFCSGITFDDINSRNGKFSSMKVYGMSKLANILHAKELSSKLKDDGISTYSLHPGSINTDFGRHIQEDYPKCFTACVMPIFIWVMKTPWHGAQTTLYCVLEDSIENESGEYYSDCAKATPSAHAQDEETAKKLWEMSEEIVGLKA